MSPAWREHDVNGELVFPRFLGDGEDLDVLQELLVAAAPRWLTCKKLLKSLDWEPGIELAAYFLLERPLVLIRRVVTGGNDIDGADCDCGRCVEAQADATSLDERWIESFEDVDLTLKWELSLQPGLCSSAGLAVPGEVVALALPHLDAVLITSAAAAVAALAEHLAGMAAATPKDAAALERSTVAAFINEARRAGKPGSVKSYTPYWRVLAFGIRLPSSWKPERIDTYAADLAAANRDQKLGLELPGDIHAQPRTDDGRLIVRAGHGHQQLGEVTQSDVQVMMKWVGAHARAKTIEQDRDRAGVAVSGAWLASNAFADSPVPAWSHAVTSKFRHNEGSLTRRTCAWRDVGAAIRGRIGPVRLHHR